MVVEMTQFGVENGRMILGCSMARRKSRVSIELGVQDFESTPPSKFHKLPRIESIQLVTEPILFHPDFKFNVQNALRIDSSSSESILKRMILVFKGLTSRLTVAAGGPPANVPATNLEIINDRGQLIGPPGKYEQWLSSASSGSVGIGYDNRPGELTVA
ncbi:hypothetical protein PIB30_093649, partial [Stylosanthes scabra]|nr:hypothetical protein [Stylosanthes scabra]